MTHNHTTDAKQNRGDGDVLKVTRTCILLALGVELLAKRDAELISETVKSLEILLILSFVFHLGADTCDRKS